MLCVVLCYVTQTTSNRGDYLGGMNQITSDFKSRELSPAAGMRVRLEKKTGEAREI